jgi:CheY-like chemotaxis protein
LLSALIVDDEPDVRALVRLVVEVAGNGLVVSGEAANGFEALEHWRRERPAAVILDHHMPGMSGLEVAEQMLEEDPGQGIILFAAYLDGPTRETAQRLGVRCLDKTHIASLPDELRALARPA